jgi:2-polyprenyl-3-methyl-5-hydroxy-6-metoxy-1,4-benzoquinol methylase
MSCPICSSKNLIGRGQRYDDRYGYKGRFTLLKCKSCNHIFLDANFNNQDLVNIYTNFYPRSNFSIDDFKPYIASSGFNAWLSGARSAVYTWVPENISILDIGCGFGESLGYHEARGCDVYGVEADENIRRVVDKFGFKVHVGLFDSTIYRANYFDYVTMNQVIEHVSNPIETIHGIAKILKPSGVVILSTPNANGWGAKFFGQHWINWHAPYHLQFFSKRSMQLAAKQAGLVLEKSITITPSPWLYYQWIHTITYTVEGKKSIFWMSSNDWSVKQKIWLRIYSLLYRVRVNDLITRLFDFFGIGDNRLYFLRKP